MQRSADLARWRAAQRAVAGGKIDQQLDRLHLRQRAAREHAAIGPDQLGQRLRQPRLAMEAASAAIGQQHARSRDRDPAGKRIQPVVGAGGAAVEPAGGLLDRLHGARPQRLVAARKHQRRMHQPGEQAVAGMADLPRSTGAGMRIGRQPAGQHALGSGGALCRRRAGGQIAQPGKAVYIVFERRGEMRGGGEIHLCDRRLDPVDQEVPGAQRHSGDPIAGQRAFHRRQQPGFRRAAERAGQRMAGHAHTVGPAHQPIDHARGRGRRRLVAGLVRFGPGLFGRRG